MGSVSMLTANNGRNSHSSVFFIIVLVFAAEGLNDGLRAQRGRLGPNDTQTALALHLVACLLHRVVLKVNVEPSERGEMSLMRWATYMSSNLRNDLSSSTRCWVDESCILQNLQT